MDKLAIEIIYIKIANNRLLDKRYHLKNIGLLLVKF